MIKYIVTYTALLIVAVSARGATVTCAGGANAAKEGQSITCQSDVAVTWSLTGVGSLSGQTTTRVTYTAPSSVPLQHAMGACPVMPNDSIFNTRIDALPVSTNSAQNVANVGSGGINFIPSWGISLADNSTPTAPIKQYYGSNQVSPNFVLPTTPALKRENGAFRSHWDNDDHHQMAVRTTDCTFWEIYNGAVAGDVTNNCQDGSAGCNATSAIEYSWSNYGLTGGTDAAALPLAALSLHVDEIKAGAVNHAMRFTSCIGCIHYAAPLWPAIGIGGCSDANVSGNPCSDSPVYGSRFRLRLCNGSSITSNCVDPSGYSTYAQTVLKALQQYGMFLADIGSEQQITVSTDVTEDPVVSAALGSITGIPITDFEVVDESFLEFSPSSVQACPYNSTVCGPNANQTNSYEQPVTQAIVTATPVAGGPAISTSLALQGVAIGLYANNLSVLAGNYSFAIPSWVNGTANQNVTWSLVSGVGSVTSQGVYTPPSSTAGGTAAVLKVVSAADPNSVAYAYVTILPPGSNPSGSIRIDSGGSGLTDGYGNTWLADQAFETGAHQLIGGDYPGWPTPNGSFNPELAVYESTHFTYGSDFLYNLAVPNGNYKVRIMEGFLYNGQPYYTTTFIHRANGRMNLEAQGQIAAHNYDFALNEPPGYTRIIATPADTYIPARVTNNMLQIAIRGVYLESDVQLYGNYCSGCMAPAINGLEIIPDSSPAHWAIDTQQATTITPGTSLQLYQVDWYTGLSDAQWSIVSGPGSISATGLYTAPAGQPTAGTGVVIKAQSASNPAISATATLRFSGPAIQYR